MKITVGSIILALIVSTFFIVLHAESFLRIKNEQGFSLKQIGQGHPFMVELVVENTTSISKPVIKGIEQFIITKTSSSMSSINGRGTVCYNYELIAPKTGEFTLGPALIEGMNIHERAEAISIKVGEQEIVTESAQREQKKQPHAFLSLQIPEQAYYVGQRIPCTLRFYSNADTIQLQNITQPELASSRTTQIVETRGGSEKRDGISYTFREWKWDLYINKAGSYEIPAYAAEFFIKRNWNNSTFFAHFATHQNIKRAYSNAAKLTINTIPFHNPAAKAVGVFTSFTAVVSPTIAKVGDALLLTVTLEGDADFESLSLDSLENIPEGLTLYPSKSAVITTNHAGHGKQFEFVVQGVREGSYKIPSQEFIFFDPYKKVFKELCTSEIPITITPVSQAHLSVPSSSQDMPIAEVSSEVIVESEGDTIATNTSATHTLPAPLGWWFFALILFVPCVPAVYGVFVASIARFSRFKRKVTPARACRLARERIASIRRSGKYKELYSVFSELTQAYSSEKKSEYTFEQLIEGEHTKKMSEEEKMAWKKFCDMLVAISFSNTSHTSSEELLGLIDRWLKRLEELA